MINELTKLATHLDSLGYHREANYVDEMLRKNADLKKTALFPWLILLEGLLWPSSTATNNACNGPGEHIWDGAGRGGCSWPTIFYHLFWKREVYRDHNTKWIAHKQYEQGAQLPDSLKRILFQEKWGGNVLGDCCTPDWLPMPQQASALEDELNAWDELPEPNRNLRLPAMRRGSGLASPGSPDSAPLEYYGPGGQYPTKD